MALYEANPRAFYDNNVNNLHAGRILQVPEIGAVKGKSVNAANREFKVQYDAWQEHKMMMAQAKNPVKVESEPAPTSAPAEKPAKTAKESTPSTDKAAAAKQQAAAKAKQLADAKAKKAADAKAKQQAAAKAKKDADRNASPMPRPRKQLMPRPKKTRNRNASPMPRRSSRQLRNNRRCQPARPPRPSKLKNYYALFAQVC